MHAKRAREAFEAFHARPAGVPVYPRHEEDDGEWEQNVVLGPMYPVGVASRVLYRSDKWHDTGDTVDYYHDHDADRITLWMPCEKGGSGTRFPYSWPDAVAVLGSCLGWYYTPTGKQARGKRELIEAKPKGTLLVASPYGHVDATARDRVFLSVVDQKTGEVVALFEGGSLRLTPHGIEG
jgi:hypothetical protein